MMWAVREVRGERMCAWPRWAGARGSRANLGAGSSFVGWLRWMRQAARRSALSAHARQGVSEEDKASVRMGWLEAWCMMLVGGADAWMRRIVPSSKPLAIQCVFGETARTVRVFRWCCEGAFGRAVSSLWYESAGKMVRTLTICGRGGFVVRMRKRYRVTIENLASRECTTRRCVVW